MTNSKNSSVEDEDEYLEIKAIVETAREFEEKGELKKAKHKFLDAAQKSLALAKTKSDVDKLSYEQIARALVDQAKEMQLLIDVDSKPLPHIPRKKGSTDEVINNVDDQKLDELKEGGEKIVILQVMIIKHEGLPVFTWVSEALSETTYDKINDILFSGAITAINQLMQEILSKPIQNIQFEGGNLMIRKGPRFFYIVYTTSDTEHVSNKIKYFETRFQNEIMPKYENEINQGLSLNKNEEVENLISSCFGI